MKKIDVLTDTFKTRLDAFTIGCDSLEDVKLWDKEAYGELDVYCLNEFVSTVLRLIVADGVISDSEVEYLNKNFGFDYTKEALKEIYENCQNEINNSFDKRILEDIGMLRSVNMKLADEFKELIGIICEIIAESDGTVSMEEQKEMDSIMNIVK